MKKSIPPFPDHYETLELPFGATAEAIRSSFRRLAKSFHPDVPITGSEPAFLKLMIAYRVISSEKRTSYDDAFKKLRALAFLKKEIDNASPIILAPARVTFSTGIMELARKGLMRKGYRTKDRRKVTGINYDIVIHIREKEAIRRVIAQIPLTVRIVCLDCMGSDLNCPACDGSGSYKSSRILKVEFPPSTIQDGRVYEFDLTKFRPDSFTHFKKKSLKVRIEILKKISLAV